MPQPLDERFVRCAAATYRLLDKFHEETDCGEDGEHWAECEALCHAFEIESWEVWKGAQTVFEEWWARSE